AGERVGQRERLTGARAAPAVEEAVGGDAEQPGAEVCPRRPAVQSAPGPEEHVLGQVLGGGGGGGHFPEPAEDPAPVEVHQSRERRAVTRARPLDQDLFVGVVHRPLDPDTLYNDPTASAFSSFRIVRPAARRRNGEDGLKKRKTIRRPAR